MLLRSTPARAHDAFCSVKTSWPAGPPEVGRSVAAAAAAAAAVSRVVMAVPPRPKSRARYRRVNRIPLHRSELAVFFTYTCASRFTEPPQLINS